MSTTPRWGLPEIAAAEEAGYLTHNQALALIDALLHPSAIDMDLSEPPSGTSDGDCYIVAETASSDSDWAGLDDDLVVQVNGAWVALEVFDGVEVFVEDEGVHYVRTGGAWVLSGTTVYEIHGFKTGKPAAGEWILMHQFARAVQFLDDFDGAQGYTDTLPDSAESFNILKLTPGDSTPTTIGTMSFDESTADATFSTTSSGAEPFAIGDILIVEAPDPQDATLEDVVFTLQGVLV